MIESTTLQFIFSGTDYYVLGSTSNSKFVPKYNGKVYLCEKILKCSVSALYMAKYYSYEIRFHSGLSCMTHYMKEE